MENAVRACLAAPDELGTWRPRRERRVLGPADEDEPLHPRPHGWSGGVEPQSPPRRDQDLARAGEREGGRRWAALYLCFWRVVVLQPLILEVLIQ